jgi:hypothetical protein
MSSETTPRVTYIFPVHPITVWIFSSLCSRAVVFKRRSPESWGFGGGGGGLASTS